MVNAENNKFFPWRKPNVDNIALINSWLKEKGYLSNQQDLKEFLNSLMDTSLSSEDLKLLYGAYKLYDVTDRSLLTQIFFNPKTYSNVRAEVAQEAAYAIVSEASRKVVSNRLSDYEAELILKYHGQLEKNAYYDNIVQDIISETLGGKFPYQILSHAAAYIEKTGLINLATRILRTPGVSEGLKTTFRTVVRPYELLGETDLTEEEQEILINKFYDQERQVNRLLNRNDLDSSFYERLFEKCAVSLSESPEHSHVFERLIRHEKIPAKLLEQYSSRLLPEFSAAYATRMFELSSTFKNKLWEELEESRKVDDIKLKEILVKDGDIPFEDVSDRLLTLLKMLSGLEEGYSQRIMKDRVVREIAAIARHPKIPVEYLEKLGRLSVRYERLRDALAENLATPTHTLDLLINSRNINILKHPNASRETKVLVLENIVGDEDSSVIYRVLTDKEIQDSLILDYLDYVSNESPDGIPSEFIQTLLTSTRVLSEHVLRFIYNLINNESEYELTKVNAGLLVKLMNLRNTPRDLRIQIMRDLKDMDEFKIERSNSDIPEPLVQDYIRKHKRRIKNDPMIHLDDVDLDIEMLVGDNPRREILFQMKNTLEELGGGEHRVVDLFSEAQNRLEEFINKNKDVKEIKKRNAHKRLIREGNPNKIPPDALKNLRDYYEKTRTHNSFEEFMDDEEPYPQLELSVSEQELRDNLAEFMSRVKELAKNLEARLGKKTINLQDIEFLLDEEKDVSDRFEISLKHVKGFDTGQNFFKGRNHFAIQVNLKREAVDAMFAEKEKDVDAKTGTTFKEWFEDFTAENVNHHILPFAGRTVAWARVHTLNKNTWLINEIQEDHSNMRGYYKALKQNPDDVYQSDPEKEVSAEKGQEWMQYVIDHVKENYMHLVINAVLQFARKKGVKHVYMLPDTLQKHISNREKARVNYRALPARFAFRKVYIDLEEKYGVEIASSYKEGLDPKGEDIKYYWYRRAHFVRKSSLKIAVKLARVNRNR